jgi:FAD-linked sulfhydryl oxidase
MASANEIERDVKKKPCRACMDFKTWIKTQNKTKSTDDAARSTNSDVKLPPNCPADREELGRSTWTFLHTMAAYYPESPSDKQQNEMEAMMRTFSKYYPCSDCSYYMKEWMKGHPPMTQNRESFSLWMCNMHNEVNERLGKPIFDCSKVDERWLDGWSDGSCD